MVLKTTVIVVTGNDVWLLLEKDSSIEPATAVLSIYHRQERILVLHYITGFENAHPSKLADQRKKAIIIDTATMLDARLKNNAPLQMAGCGCLPTHAKH